MSDVNLPHDSPDSAWHNRVVQSAGAQASKKPAGDAQPPSGESGTHFHGGGPVQDAGKNHHVHSRGRKAIHLLPGHITDPVCPPRLLGKLDDTGARPLLRLIGFPKLSS